MDCSPPGSSVHRISQARILEWVAISFSRETSWPRAWTHISCFGKEIFTTEPLGKLNFFDSPFVVSVMVVHSLHCYKYSVWWKKYFYTCGWVFGLFPAFYWWMFGRLPDICYYEQCFHKHQYVSLVYMCRNSSGVSMIPLMLPQGISGLHSVFVHEFIRYARNLLAAHPTHFLWLHKKPPLPASPEDRMGLYSRDLAAIMWVEVI